MNNWVFTDCGGRGAASYFEETNSPIKGSWAGSKENCKKFSCTDEALKFLQNWLFNYCRVRQVVDRKSLLKWMIYNKIELEVF